MNRTKNEEYKKSQIRTIQIFSFDYKNCVLLKNIVWKSSLYHHIFLEFLCVAEYLKCSNDTSKLMWIYISF